MNWNSLPRGAALFRKLANKNRVKYSHVWHPSAGCQISVMGYTLKLCAYVEMAKTYHLNLYEYLKFLFDHRPNKDMTDEEFENLAPWNARVQELCK